MKLMRYNKSLQNKMDIDLIDYKVFSGKYIIYLENGIGIEYDILTHERLFEGEYSKGERNGKGKEYNGDFIKFEGNYLNGKRHGMGIEYYYNNGSTTIEAKITSEKREFNIRSEIKFEGEYLNGKRWNGKIYKPNFSNYLNNKNDNNISGEIKSGKGVVQEYNDLGSLLFQGEYVNGERNGKGLECNLDGNLLFEGEYLNGKKWNGIVYANYDWGKCEKYELKDGKGYLKECNLHGYLIFEGEYSNGEKNGKGKEYYSDFSDNAKISFEGEFLNGKRFKGKEYDYNGQLYYEGEYLNGAKIRGKEYYKDCKIRFEGKYFNNKIVKGKEYNYKGELRFEGEFIHREKRSGNYIYAFSENEMKMKGKEEIIVNNTKYKLLDDETKRCYDNESIFGRRSSKSERNGIFKDYDENNKLILDEMEWKGI